MYTKQQQDFMYQKERQKTRIRRRSLMAGLFFIAILCSLCCIGSIASWLYSNKIIMLGTQGTIIFVVSLIALTATAIFLLFGPYLKKVGKMKQKWMDQYGIQVLAVVDGQWITRGDGKAYNLRLIWQDPQTGITHAFHQQVPQEKYHPQGTLVPVQFDPYDSSFFIVDGLSHGYLQYHPGKNGWVLSGKLFSTLKD